MLSPLDLAGVCAVPLSTVYEWNYKGTGPPVIRLGKHVRYREADVERWLAERLKAS
jgi:predicted DNA-binding transcriptional regulator AlpA